MRNRTRTITIGYTWSVFDEEIDFRLTCRCTPATPDVWYLPNGDPGYPGDPAEIEVVQVECIDANLTDDQRRIFAAAFQELADMSTLLADELLERCGEADEPEPDPDIEYETARDEIERLHRWDEAGKAMEAYEAKHKEA